MGNIISSCRKKSPKCNCINKDKDNYNSNCGDTTQPYQNFNRQLYNNCLENLYLENHILKNLTEQNNTQDIVGLNRSGNIATRSLYKTKSLSEVFLDKPISIKIDLFGGKDHRKLNKFELRKRNRDIRLLKAKHLNVAALPQKSHSHNYLNRRYQSSRDSENYSNTNFKKYNQESSSEESFSSPESLNQYDSDSTLSNNTMKDNDGSLKAKKRASQADNKIFSNLYSQVSDSSRNISIDNDRKLSIRESDHESKRGTEPSAKYQYTEDDLGELKDFESLPLNDQLESIKCSSKRLKTIRSALNKPKEEFFNLITRKDLKKNLDFIIKVLENSLADEKKQVISRIQSDDDALSEIEPELVSSEVRNWLSMTFTRTASNLKKRKDNEKPKFKNVAHAIRAGIMVDRMLRRMSSSLESTVPVQVSTILKTLNNWNFEVFQMNEVSDGQALRHIGFELMQKFNILSKFKIQNLVMQNFLEAVEAGYSKYKNPYHNLVHAADVLQTLYNILNNAGLMNWLTSIEIFAVFISAIVHDFEHTGTTNNFHMQTRSDIALIYNDRAVLENYHISTTFRLMKNDSYNILQELSREEYKEFRNLCIEMILATDMSYHFSQLKTIKTMINLNEPVDKPKALSLILHCADISHPSKTWHLHEQWTNSLVEEFFAQGDKEKELGLPFSPLCDRNNTPIAQSQIGFINFIVEPSLAVMGDMIDKLLEQLLAEGESTKSNDSKENEKRLVARPWSPFLSENKAKWQALAEAEKLKKEEEEKKKETDNKIEEKS